MEKLTQSDKVKDKNLPLSFTAGFFLIFGGTIALVFLDLFGRFASNGYFAIHFWDIQAIGLFSALILLTGLLRLSLHYRNWWKFLVGGIVATCLIVLIIMFLSYALG
jgi:hypothetical protein